MDYASVTRCRACGSSALERVLDLGSQPLANCYVKEPTALPAYPLELMVCRNCLHNQLSVVVQPDLMFRHYLYVSGTSQTFRNHFESLAQQTLHWFSPRPRRALDLASNDGTLLEALRCHGCTVCGIDPALNLVEIARQKDLTVVAGYWPQVRDEVPGAFDLITACNVLAHVADPRSFLEAALARLTPSGAVVVEFPYARTMVLQNLWDTIYHEHLSYFLVRPFLRLVESLGARVTRCQQVPIHGGSLRLAIQSSPSGHCPEILQLAEAEEQDGLARFETYRRFAHRVDTTCAELKAAVDEARGDGRRVIGYGASAKGNTLLNRCRVSLEYIVDDNPLKHGYLTPGQNIPIFSPTLLAQETKEIAVLLLAWNFAAEIVGNIRAQRGNRNDQVIHYVPAVRRHGIEEPLPPWPSAM